MERMHLFRETGRGFSGDRVVNNVSTNEGDAGSIPESEDALEEEMVAQ